MTTATPEKPLYAKIPSSLGTTNLYSITVDEGWRSTIVCSDMYEWAADWLVEELQGKPFAPGWRP